MPAAALHGERASGVGTQAKNVHCVIITHAIKWSFLAEIASKAIAPLVFVILARLLTPDDYGVVAAATMVISFSQVFWEAGMAKAVVQYQGDRCAGANAAFWVNVFLGAAVAVFLVMLSGWVSERVFHDARVATVLRIMSLQVFLSAAGSVHTALLQKDFRFKSLFWVRLLTVATPALISIPLALEGVGYWALVAGTLAGQAIQVVILWRISHWRPSLSFDAAVARRLARFGIWVTVSGLAAWFYLWGDSLIVGMFLGAHDLGLYRTGNAFVIMIYGFLFGPLLPVLYSHLSEIQSDRARISQVLSKTVRLITFISIPTGFVLYAMPQLVGDLVFGPEWTGIAPVIATMALTHGLAWTVGANGEAYRAIGRPDYETKVMASTLPFYALAYWVSIQHGFTTFLWARFAMAVAATGLQIWVAHLAVALPIARTLLYLAKVSVVGLPLIVIGHYLETQSVGILLQATLVAIAAGWTILYLWTIEHKALIPETLGILRPGARR